jgi:hypothetical protein
MLTYADMQTASLLLCYFSTATWDTAERETPGKTSVSSPVKAPVTTPVTWARWLDEYRDMLDRWQMWEQVEQTLNPKP